MIEHQDYFELAVNLARNQAADTLAKIKRKQEPCRCAAYPFPHREGSKACAELEQMDRDCEYESCRHCSGTGEGGFDGSTCGFCRGRGV